MAKFGTGRAPRRAGSLFALALLSAPVAARAQSGSWAVDADGNWGTAAKWTGSVVADGAGNTATFSLDISADRTITLDSSRTIGGLVFQDMVGSNSFTLAATGGSVLTLSGGSAPTISVSAGQTAFISAPLAGTDGFNFSNSGTLVLGGNNSALSGTIAISSATLRVADDSNLGTGSLLLGTNGTLLITGTSFNSSKAVALNGLVNTFRVDAGDAATLGGVISGNRLTKAGTGTLTLGGANTYSVATFLNGGTLSVSSDANLGDSSAALNFNGGTLRVTGAAFTSTARTINWGAAGGGLDIANTSNTFSVAQLLSGGSLTKSGAGILALTNSNTYTGGTFLNAGRLSVASDASLGDSSGALNFNGGTLQVTGTAFTSTARTINWGAAGGGFDIADPSNTFTVSQLLSGAGGLTSFGAGTLALTANNNYTGTTTLVGGRLQVSSGANLGTGTLSVVFDGTIVITGTSAASFSQSVSLFSVPGAHLTIQVDNPAGSTFGGPISGGGQFAAGLTKTGPGTLTLTAANSYTGGTVISAGTLSVSSDANLGNASGALSFNGGTLQITGTGFTATARAINWGGGGFDIADPANTFTVAQLLSGAGGLAKSGAGTLALTNTNTYAGGTFLNAGALRASFDGNLGTASGALNFNGGMLQVTGTAYTSTARTINCGAAGGGFDIADPTNSFAVSQAISGTGGLTKAGAGTLVLTGVNTYSGATNVNAGVLQLGVNALVTPGGTVNIASGAGLTAAGYISRTLAGSGSVTATGALTLGDLSSPTGYDFGGTLNVGGNQVVLFSAAKARLGAATNISAGGTLVTVNGALLGGGADGITVDAGKVLSVTGGTATVQGAFTNNGHISVAAGGQLVFQNLVKGGGDTAGTVVYNGGWSPGNSPASVSAGDVVLGSFNTLTMELGGTTPGSQYDHVTVSGTLSAGGVLEVTDINGFNPSAGDSFDLFDGTLSGTFSSVNLPTLSAGLAWNTSQLYTTGIISVQPVPEPASLIALGLAAGAGAHLLRRRRRA